MINIHVNAAYCLFDGFAGRPALGSQVAATLDGRPYTPIYKAGGWFVLTDQPEGAHVVEFSGAGFLPERFEENFSAEGHIERSVVLKPSAKYPFGGARVSSLLFDFSEQFWYAAEDPRLAIKLAQAKAQSGETKLTLFYPDAVYEKLLLSGEFMIVDSEKSEICAFERLEGGEGVLSAGLKNEHNRGTMLYQAARLFPNQGDMTARFNSGCKKVFALTSTKKGAKLSEFELKAGECLNASLK